MLSWSLKEIELPLKFTWRISRGSFKTKKNFVVEIKNAGLTGLGEVAFTGRNSETKELVEAGFARFVDSIPGLVRSVEEMIVFLDDLELPNSLRFGIESAFVHYLSALSEKTVFELLGVPSVNVVQTSISIPIMSPGKVSGFIQKYDLCRFHAIKVKIDVDGGDDLVREASKSFNGMIRIDANEAFSDPDEVLRFSERITDLPVEFLEQPMPAGFHDEYLYLKKKSPFNLIADESITTENVTTYFSKRFHGVNIKLMKAGGYLKAMQQLRTASGLGLKTMLGCMIETSLGISSAFNLAHGVDYIDLDSVLFLESDPYNLILEEHGKLFLTHLH